MKKLLLLMFIPAFFPFTVKAQNKWKLIWSDEFNYKGLPDSTKWSYDTGGRGWGNNELQFYTSARAKNARVENGRLIIQAHKEKMDTNRFTSARLVSKGKGDWTYVRIAVNARLPRAVGSWPAIWMLASATPLRWPDDGEIDIMEHVGYDPGKVHGSVHTKKYNHVIGTQKTGNMMVTDAFTRFHIYEIEWSRERIDFFIDKKKYYSFANEHKTDAEWPFNKPFHLLLNLAVGGNWGGAKGVDEKSFPQRMEIDYVRVYEAR